MFSKFESLKIRLIVLHSKDTYNFEAWSLLVFLESKFFKKLILLSYINQAIDYVFLD